MEKYLEEMLKEAEKAYKKKEVPVGAIVIYNTRIIGRGHNNRQNSYTVLGHAEINAILQAERKLKDWRLDSCEMYVTLEPCEMCKKIIEESRISKVFYLVSQFGVENSKYIHLNVKDERYNDYFQKLQTFFKKLR